MKILKTLVIMAVMAMVLAMTVAATGQSVQLKRTNPGIAGEKSAEIIFDVVNTDMTHKIEGFIWCRSPDDVTISGTYGAASGSGAQYVSEKFIIDKGPAQKSMSLTIDSTSIGDKTTGCTIKYMPFKETDTETTTTVETEEPFTTSLELSAVTADVNGYMMTLVSYTEQKDAVKDENDTVVTEMVPATAVLKIDGVDTEFEIGKEKEVDGLKITVTDAAMDTAQVTVSGMMAVEKEEPATGTTRMYLKQNGDYVTTPVNEDYMDLRLDKTVPFVAPSVKNPACPEGQTSCTANEVVSSKVDIAGSSFPIWIVVLIVLVVLVVVYLLGKTSRH